MTIYTHIYGILQELIKIRVHKFEREKDGLYGRILIEEKVGASDIIIL